MFTIKNTLSLFVFLTAFVIYLICLPTSITFWDAPEFIVSNYKLHNTHPAGAPFYTLLSNVLIGVFSFIPPVIISNGISAFFGALTILFLFYSILMIAEKLTKYLKTNTKYLSYLCGVIGSLSFAFSYSFWLSATETEVYTLSFFLLIFIFWLALQWYVTHNKQRERKLLLLVFLFLGVSLGVHLINIAIVIVFPVFYVAKRYGFTFKRLIGALFLGLILFVLLFNILFQGFISIAGWVDVFVVNNWSYPVHFGAIAMLVMLFLGLFLGVIVCQKYGKERLYYSFLCLFLYFLGSTSYLMPIIRSQANTSISSSVNNVPELGAYIRAEQFGVHKIPLLKGYSFNAPLNEKVPFLKGKEKYSYNIHTKKYEIIPTTLPNYDNQFSMYFPRVFNQSPVSVNGYKDWARIKGTPINVTVNGKQTTIFKPTFTENLSFFYNYQINWLYLRYLFKNFIGKQNDLKGVGIITNGNWISGVNYIDKYNVGDISKTPSFYLKQNTRDTYYFLPFLLGVLGLFFLRKNKLFFYTTLGLFLLFGLGISIFVNPVPQSILIRERDYIFTASFMFFSIWIGLGTIAVFMLLSFFKKAKVQLLITTIITLLIAPLQLLAKGFDNHNRSNEFFAYELAKTYLKDCPEQAILVTNSDNLTFPLVYLQEVENFRTDVRIINYDLLPIAHNIRKLQKKQQQSNPLKLNISENYINSDVETRVLLTSEINSFFNINNLATYLPKSKREFKGKEFYNIPTTKFCLPLSTVKKKMNFSFQKGIKQVDTLYWNIPKNELTKADVVLLDIIASNLDARPILFAETGKQSLLNLTPYLVQKGINKELLSLKVIDNKKNAKITDTKISYKNLVTDTPFKQQNNKLSKVTDESFRASKSILRRQYYFLAQAFLEENDTIKALKTLDYCTKTFPDETIPFEQYAFALGKLYYRTNEKNRGEAVCTTAIKNLEAQLELYLSFDVPRPIINIKYANRLFDTYKQMIVQLAIYDKNLALNYNEKKKQLNNQIIAWRKKNWPN